VLQHLRTRAPMRSCTASPERRRCCAHGEGNHSLSPAQEDTGEGTPGRDQPLATAPPRACALSPGSTCARAPRLLPRAPLARATPAAAAAPASASAPPALQHCAAPTLARRRQRRVLPAPPEPRGGERGAAGVEIRVEARERDADGGETKERTPERRETEEKEKRDFPRTCAQI
jgi:hypothetical protein